MRNEIEVVEDNVVDQEIWRKFEMLSEENKKVVIDLIASLING